MNEKERIHCGRCFKFSRCPVVDPNKIYCDGYLEKNIQLEKCRHCIRIIRCLMWGTFFCQWDKKHKRKHIIGHFPDGEPARYNAAVCK